MYLIYKMLLSFQKHLGHSLVTKLSDQDITKKIMRERVKPSMTFLERLRYEEEHEEELLAERLKKLKKIREMKERGETPTDYSSK